MAGSGKSRAGEAEEGRQGLTCGLGLGASLHCTILMVDGLAGQRDDPDLSHLDRGLFDAAAEAQNLATLRGVLHHLWNMGLDVRRASIPESSNTQEQGMPSRRLGRKPEKAQGQSRLAE